MKWDQIETKWALMTRRIRADLCDDHRDAVSARSLKRSDPMQATIAESQKAVMNDPKFKTSAK
ncbi:MAG: hypothetical protein U1E69_01785 [Tabrizicola sp.]|uniref:hypothetical protein n=1 Tax=Tabrizicola sp. TaxID=2005166 RepID=UPI002AB94F37|nr:hypothetical protein [Tabrizicola sp.]MDZ4085509.1 hypothetical protein [Tabrizicola sp.]